MSEILRIDTFRLSVFEKGMAQLAEPIVLEATKLIKQFSGVTVVKGVDLKLVAGQAVGLVGENGAGKSTVIKMLSGVYRPDGGAIYVSGQKVSIPSPSAAHKLGIFTVHQEPSLMPELSVAENVFMGFHPVRRIGPVRWLERKTMYERADEMFHKLAISLDVRTAARDLTIAEQQMVEIAKALVHDVRVLILDEPTATLSQYEVDTLFRVVRELMDRGTAVLFVSHRLHEVLSLCSHVTVMRDGDQVGQFDAKELTPELLVSHMVGRDVNLQRRASPVRGDKPKLQVRHLTKKEVFRDISLEVYPGEIVGLAGLVGSRRTDVAEALFGISPADQGEILLDGKPIQIRSTQDALKSGIVYVPEDRHRHGVALSLSIARNIAVPNAAWLYRWGIARNQRERMLAERLKSELQIKARSTDQRVEHLSGGNQQKVVFGKWVARAPQVMILDEPTRGVDVGAKSEIYRVIYQLASSGVAVIVISSDLPEILTLSDRILVMREGALMGEIRGEGATEEMVMQLATGVSEQPVGSAQR